MQVFADLDTLYNLGYNFFFVGIQQNFATYRCYLGDKLFTRHGLTLTISTTMIKRYHVVISQSKT